MGAVADRARGAGRARKPAGMTWEAAAAFAVPALTASQVLDGALDLTVGETLLVNGPVASPAGSWWRWGRSAGPA